MTKPAVLFLCTHNAGRSQMAMGFFRHLAGDRANVYSGGSEPADRTNPVAIAAMAEKGIDIGAEQPKQWTVDMLEAVDVVITMGCGDSCPVLPGRRYEDWLLPDPAGEALDAVRPIRDEIERRVRNLLDRLGARGLLVHRLDPPVTGGVTLERDGHPTSLHKEEPMVAELALDPAITAHIAAINSFDVDGIMDTFADDALVNDFSREFWGGDRIRAFMSKEFVGDHVTVEPVEVVENAGMWCVRCRYEGDYDKTGLPDPLIMTNYFRLRDGKIVTLFVIKNTEPQY